MIIDNSRDRESRGNESCWNVAEKTQASAEVTVVESNCRRKRERSHRSAAPFSEIDVPS
jgi:hypothetical protein